MHPILFRCRGLLIHSYPALLYLGAVAGSVVGAAAARQAGLDPARVLVATLLLLAPALVGARLLFVALHWGAYRRHPSRIWNRGAGGAAMYGALPCMLVASVPLLSALGLPPGMFWDVATFSILTGMIFTRIGCLLHGCCAGRPSAAAFALNLANHEGVWRRRIPTQLLEAGLAALLLAGALAIRDRVPFPGAVFLLALAGYGLGRLFLESARECPDRVAGFRVQQVLSGVLLAGALGGLLLASVRLSSNGVAPVPGVRADWLVLLVPLVALVTVVPFVFVGCSLMFQFEEKKEEAVRVRFRVSFDPFVGSRVASFDEILPETFDVLILITGRTADGEDVSGEVPSAGGPDRLIEDEGTVEYVLETEVVPGSYDFTCHVFGASEETAGPVVGPTTCRVEVPAEGRTVVFSADRGSAQFNPCE